MPQGSLTDSKKIQTLTVWNTLKHVTFGWGKNHAINLTSLHVIESLISLVGIFDIWKVWRAYGGNLWDPINPGG